MAAKKQPPKPKQKQWFVVRVEGLAPVIVEYRVFAESEQEAFDTANRSPTQTHLNSPPKIDLPRMKKIKASVKSMTSSFINWTKTF